MGRVMPSSNVAGILFHLQSRYKLNKESKTKLNKERKIPRGNKLCKKIKQPNVGNLTIFLRKTPHQIFFGICQASTAQVAISTLEVLLKGTKLPLEGYTAGKSRPGNWPEDKEGGATCRGPGRGTASPRPPRRRRRGRR